MSTLRYLATPLVICGCLAALAARADDQQSTPAQRPTTEQTPATELPKMTVQDTDESVYVTPITSTGTKTDTPVMETPVNVQSVSSQVLNDQQATTLKQALQNVSGTQVTGGLLFPDGLQSSGILVRGFVENTFYRDGFRVDGSLNAIDVVSSRQLANIDSVDVLKGPGAVLYGLIEPGGIVNVVTKQPLSTPYYSVQQQVGSYDYYRTAVDATGPIANSGDLLYRLNLSYENNGAPFGYPIDLVSSNNLFLAPVIKWNIDDATWVKLEWEFSRNRSDIYWGYDPLYNGTFVSLPRSINYGDASPSTQTSNFLALSWSHDFTSAWSLKQQIAYNHIASDEHSTLPFNLVSPTPPLEVEQSSFQVWLPTTAYSTDIDLIGHLDALGVSHTLLIGANVNREYAADNTDYSSNSLISFENPVHPGILDPSPCTYCGWSYSTWSSTDAGLYVQDQIKLPHNVNFLIGERLQYIHQDEQGAVATGTPLSDHAFTPRVGLLWHAQDWLSLYGNYTKGFGSNLGSLVYPGVLAPPSNARSWEAGAKFESYGGRLRITADYFDLVKTNVPTFDPDPATNCAGNCASIIGETRSNGAELDIQGEIRPGWNLIANYALDNVRVTEAGPGNVPPLGQQLPLEPRILANLWTTYEFRGETLRGLKIGIGYNFSGARPVPDYGGNPAGTFPDLKAYGTANAMAAYSRRIAGKTVTAQVNISNLFDKSYIESEYSGAQAVPGYSTGWSLLQYGAARSVVGSIKVEL